jgi:hypothetical protein
MYPSSQLMPTRASGGRSVAAIAATALVVSLVSLHLAVLPRATVPTAPPHGENPALQQSVQADRQGIVFRGR